MSRFVPPGLALLALAGVVAARPTQTSADEAEIRQVVQYYFDGAATVERAFRQDAHMYFVRDGAFVDVPIPEYIARVKAAPPRTGPKPDQRIESIDVTGTAAVARLKTVQPGAVIVDYMSLLKVDGKWVIVNKIFDRNLGGTGR